MRKAALTKTEKAYQSLRKAIVTGQILPNGPLHEHDLMKRFGHGRTPIREALKRLTLERFVVWPARSTPYVKGVSPQDLQRLYEARLTLEGPIARMAARRITEPELKELDRLCVELEQAIAAGEIYKATEIDYAIHIAIAQGSDNIVLAEAVGHLIRGCLHLWYNAGKHFGVEATPLTHLSIVESLRARDAEACVEKVNEHIFNSYRRQLKLMELSLEEFMPSRLKSIPEVTLSGFDERVL